MSIKDTSKAKSKDIIGLIFNSFFVLILMVFAILIVLPPVLALDDLMALQGNVKKDGINLDSGNLTVYLFDAYSGGNLIYNSTPDFDNAISNGKYDVMLGNGTNELNLEFGTLYYMEVYVNEEAFTFNGADRQLLQSSVGQINGSFIEPRQINITHLIVDIDLSNATNIQSSAVNKSTGIFFLQQFMDSIIDTIYSFNISGSNIFPRDLDFLLGIGTSSPTATLDVAGNVNISQGLNITDNDLNVLSGNVGIGTSTPTQALDVRGEGNFSGTIFINNGTDISSLGTNVFNQDLNITSNAVFANITSTGNLTIVDNATFQDSINVTNDVYINDIAVLQWLYNQTDQNGSLWTQIVNEIYYIGGNIGIGTSSPTAALDVVGNVNVSTLNVTVGDLNVITGNVGIGTTNPGSLLTVSGGDLNVSNATDNHLFVDGSLGRVGIGTSSPSEALHVFGSGATTFRLQTRSGSTSEGPNSAANAENDSSNGGAIAWKDPRNVFVDDTSYAEAQTFGAATSYYLNITNYSFSIPAGAEIDGIEVEVLVRAATGGGMFDDEVKIIKGGVLGTADRANSTGWTAIFTYLMHGSTEDLWGETWTPDDINADDFGFAISMTVGGIALANIDHARVTVYYSTNSQNWVTGIDNANNNNLIIAGSTALGTNEFFAIDTTGNVGIGITTPRATLDVEGNILIGNTTSTGNLTVVLNATFQDSLNVTNEIFIGDIGVSQWLYNQTIDGGSFNESYDSFNSTINIQHLINVTNIYSTFNGTYLGFNDSNNVGALGFASSTQLNDTYLELTDTTTYLNFTPSGTIDFNLGWQNGGLTISDGNLFAQAIFVVNITSLGVSNLNINGSLLPDSAFDDTFDIGSASLRWRDLFISRDVNVSANLLATNINASGDLYAGGILVNDWLYNQTQTLFSELTDDIDAVNRNLFNQDLNTTNNPTFFNLTITNNLTVSDEINVTNEIYINNNQVSIWLYNQSGGSFNQTYIDINSTVNIQELINSTDIYSTFNITYSDFAYNQSTNTSYDDLFNKPQIITNDSEINLTSLSVFNRFLVNSTDDYALWIQNTTTGQNLLFVNASDGFVGIGTAAPTQALNVVGGVNITGALNVSEFLFVNATQIGIGTSTPETLLHISGANSPVIRVEDTTNNVQTVFQADDTFGILGTESNNILLFATNAQSAMSIDTDQNIGIGTLDATAKLECRIICCIQILIK